MVVWLPLLILSASPTAPMEHRYAVPVFETDFGESDDLNYDGWPDNWTRRRGQGFPHYVKVRIEDDPTGTSGTSRCLRVDLDGGGAVAYSPPIDIDPLFSYVCHGRIQTAGLKHNVAYFSVSFFDRDRVQKETYTSEKLTKVSQWRKLHIGPLTPTNPDACLAVIGLHLVPTHRSDLTGAAMFDDVRLARLPNMVIHTGQPHNLFFNPEEPEITCVVSGIERSDAAVSLELLDVSGRTLISEEKRLTRSERVDDEPFWPDDVASGVAAPTVEAIGLTGTVTWRPRFPGYGFYHVRASLRSDDSVALQRSMSVAVLRTNDSPREGEYGWSLTRDSNMPSDSALTMLLNVANASWIKYPIWYSPEEETAEGERIAALADHLNALGIEMVGVFDRPPQQFCRRFVNKEDLTVAEAFLEPDMWRPAIDPLMIQLSLKIQWWQLGADNDDSFVDYQGLEQKAREIRSHLKKFGQRARLGFAWQWMHAIPQSSDPPWDFLAMTETPSFSQLELARYAKHVNADKVQNWVTLWPLPSGNYDHQTRAKDLVLRMIQAKINGAKAIFAGNPCDQARGLLNQDGTPQDLFLPWCITSRMVSGAEYLGSLQLPNGSPNHVFAQDNEALMVVWNETPATESLYLGEQVTQIDLWGRESVLPNSPQPTGQTQNVSVGPVPAFLTGLDLAVARWRLNFSFQEDELASVFGRQQTAQFRFQNTFVDGVGGTLDLHVPPSWKIATPRLRFKLATGEDVRQDFGIMLQANSSSGPQPLRIDFDVFADRQIRFSVFRTMQVGLGDVIVELDTWLDDDGRLIIEQHLTNQTDSPLSLNCYLFAPGRRRLRMQVFEIGQTRITQAFALQNGRELLGQTLWLRVEELGGERLQNHRIVAKP